MISCTVKGDTAVGNMSCFSPNGVYVAAVSGSRLMIRETNDLSKIIQMYSCVDKIEKIEFSPDSEYIYCALYARNAIQVFSIKSPDWKCRINEGIAGVINAMWSPDSRNIITESDFGVCMTVWSLIENTNVILSLPKPPHRGGFKNQLATFTHDKKHLVLVHRMELQDHIAIYQYTPRVTEVNKFRARSGDIACIQVLPNDTHLLTIDSPLHYKCCIYTMSGECLMQYAAYEHALGLRSYACFNNQAMATYRSYQEARVASQQPTSPTDLTNHHNKTQRTQSFIALGSFDGKVRIMSMYSWQIVFVFPCIHPKEMDFSLWATATSAVVTKVEIQSRDNFPNTSTTTRTSITNTNTTSPNHRNGQQNSFFEEEQQPQGESSTISMIASALGSYTQPKSKLDTLLDMTTNTASSHDQMMSGLSGPPQTVYIERMLKTLPKSSTASTTSSATSSSAKSSTLPSMGIHWIGWSDSGAYLASLEESYPRCLWIWSPYQSRLMDCLVQLDPITCAEWKPVSLVSPVTLSDTSDSDAGSGGEGRNLGVIGSVTLPTKQTGIIPAEEELVPAENTPQVLAFCTGNSSLYFWTDAHGIVKCDAIFSADQYLFNIHYIRWNRQGNALLLKGKESFGVCHVHFQ